MSQNEKNAHKPTREAHAINNKVLWLWESKAVCTSQQRQLSSVEWWKVTLRIFLASHVISIFDWICLIVCKVSGSTTFNRTIYCRPVVESSNRKDLSSRWVCVRIIPGKRSFACNARICIVIDFYLLLLLREFYFTCDNNRLPGIWVQLNIMKWRSGCWSKNDGIVVVGSPPKQIRILLRW